jgi:sulfate adenylyltransferase subunit 1
LGVRHVIVAVNKMDLVDFSQQVFDDIRREYLAFAEGLNIPDIRFVPISALRGDNVVSASERAPWYNGPTLMNLLETVELESDAPLAAFRLPVQYVNRPNLDFRGFCGTIAAGHIRPGDTVQALPGGKTSKVKAIVTADGELPYAHAGQAVTLTLEDEIDISRGDMLVHVGETAPKVAATLTAHLVWMDETPLTLGKEYLFKLGGKKVTGRVSAIDARIDVNTLEASAASELKLNEIGRVTVALNAAAAFDAYTACRGTGGFIIVDRISNATAAAGMVIDAVADASQHSDADELARLRAFEVELNALVRRYFPHWEAKDIVSKLG